MLKFSRGKKTRVVIATAKTRKSKTRYTIPFLAVILFAGSLIFTNLTPPKAKAAIALDANLTSSPAHNDTAAGSISVNTSSAAAAQSKIILFVTFYLLGNDSIASVSGGGLSWYVDTTVGTTSSGPKLAIVSADAPAGLASGTTITVNFTSSSTQERGIAAASYTGLALGNSHDGTNNSVNGTATWSGGAVNTLNNDDLIIGLGLAEGGAGSATSTPSLNYNEIHDWNDSTAGAAWESVYRIVSSTGSYTPGGTFSVTPGASSYGISASFKTKGISLDANLGNSLVASSGASTFTTGAQVASRSTVVLFVRAFNGASTTLTVTGGGLTWTNDLQKDGNSADHIYVVSAYAPAGLAAGTNLTLTFSNAMNDIWTLAQSFAGISADSATRVDQSNSSWPLTANNTYDSGNITTAYANDLLFGGAFFDNVTATFTPGTNYYEIQDTTTSGMSLTTEFRVVSSTGTYSASGTASSSLSASRASAIVAYKSSSTPAAPTLNAPSNGATGVSTLPQFQLRSTDAEDDNLKYKIEVCSTSNCSSIVRTIDQTSSQTGWTGQDQESNTAYTGNNTISSSTMASHTYQATALSGSTQYWWRAYAYDSGGTNTFGTNSSIYSFTTTSVGNTAPATPTLIYPQTSATNISNFPIFQLRTTDTDSDYLQYFIQLYDATNCGGSQVGSNFDQTSSQSGWQSQDAGPGNNTGYIGSPTLTTSSIARYQYGGTVLSNNHLYSWRAKAKDPGGSNTFSSLTSCSDFTTGTANVQIDGGTQIGGGTIIQ